MGRGGKVLNLGGRVLSRSLQTIKNIVYNVNLFDGGR